MKTSISNLFFIASIIFTIAACSSPSSQGENAEVGEAREAAPVADSAEWYGVDIAKSVITWIGSKPTGQHNGTIGIAEGQLAVYDGKITGGQFTIDIKSLQDHDLSGEDKAKLETHLMSEDFFSADEYPTAVFQIVSAVPFDTTETIEDKAQFKSKYTPATLRAFMVKNPTHKISGNLTMRGITKNVTFPARVAVGQNQVEAEAKFNIDRTDWNLSYRDEASVVDKAQDQFIYNTVNVGLNLVANKEAEPEN